jgi:tRNA threonylcarbamoyl adenosine modification protein (Sua5/YciO/YrdC/YwlC family)
MIEYVVAQNPDSRVLKRAASILEGGGLVVLPTDTSWSVVCSIASKEGIARLKRLGELRDRPPTVMCATLSSASELCDIDSAAFRLMKRLTPGPYVFILKSSVRVAKDFDLKRQEIGVRIPRHKVPLSLMEELGRPLLSATAKKTMLEAEQEEPEFPEELLFSGGGSLRTFRMSTSSSTAVRIMSVAWLPYSTSVAVRLRYCAWAPAPIPTSNSAYS